MAYKLKIVDGCPIVYDGNTRVDICDIKADDFTISLLDIVQELLTGSKVWYYSKLYPYCKFASTDKDKVDEVNRLTDLLQKKDETIYKLRKEIKSLKRKE